MVWVSEEERIIRERDVKAPFKRKLRSEEEEEEEEKKKLRSFFRLPFLVSFSFIHII